MDILGNGGNGLKSILGTSGGGGGGGGGPVLKGVKTVFTFNADNTELKNDFNIIDGEIVLKDPEQGDIRFTNGNDTNTRGIISYSDTTANINYTVDTFKITSATNDAVLMSDKQGRVGLNKAPDVSYQVDVSGSINLASGGTLYQGGYDILYNLGKLFDYLTKPPPAFDYNNMIQDKYSDSQSIKRLSIQRTSFNVTLFWKKGEAYDTSYNFGLEQKNLPYVDKIGVEIIDKVDKSGVLKEWVKVEPNDIGGGDVSYTIGIDTTYTDTQGNSFTIDKDESFNIRVYPINSTIPAGQVPNYLEFYDLTFVGPSPPTAPSDLSVGLVNGIEQRAFTLTFTKPAFNDSVVGKDEGVSNDPPLIEYRIDYQPRVSGCKRFPQVYDTSLIRLERAGTNSTTTYTVTDDGTTNVERVYPATTYDISLSAKNNQTDNSFGDVSSVVVTTQLPKSTDFSNVSLTAIGFTGFNKSITNFRVGGGTDYTDKKYFNIHSNESNELTATDHRNSLFVNYTKLGVDSSGQENLATVQVYHQENNGTKQVDASLVFHGYRDSNFNSGYHGWVKDTHRYQDQIELVDPRNEDANAHGATKPEYYGFGLIGSYELVFWTTENNNVIGYADGDNSKLKFVPSTNIYTIGYDVSGTNINKEGTNSASVSMSFVVDDLSGDPIIQNVSHAISNVRYLYSYGVPSIQDFDYSLNWQTANNGRYILPYNGVISKIQEQPGSGSFDSSISSQTYNASNVPKDQTYHHAYQSTIYPIVKLDTSTVSNVFDIRSYHVLNTTGTSVTRDISCATTQSLYCDYASFEKSGSKINGLNSFGKDGIYTYQSGDPYTLSPPFTADTSGSTPANNQLIYFDGRFVNPKYIGHPYRNFTVFGPTSPISIDYTEYATSGDNNNTVKWLIKKVASNIIIDANSQQRSLTITDINGEHSNYGNYNGRLFLFQTYATGERVSGWLNPNVDFDSQNAVFTNNIGVRNSSDASKFFLYAEGEKTFDVYVRIGLLNDSTTQTWISNLVLSQ